jgi:hypothetical protein
VPGCLPGIFAALSGWRPESRGYIAVMSGKRAGAPPRWRGYGVADALLTLALAVGVAWALGALFEWLWAPPPTPENSSPPPEAFLFFYGALIGFVAVVLVRVMLVPFWLERRRRRSSDF